MHGSQEGSAYNGHFGCNCYHPLFVFNQHGDLERCALRPGNVHSAHDWQAVLGPVIKRYRWSGLWRRYLRADAAFAIPELFDYLEANDFGYAIRLRGNKVLERRIAHLLKRRPGRPSGKIERHYARFTYRAKSWNKPRPVQNQPRVVVATRSRLGKRRALCQSHCKTPFHLGDAGSVNGAGGRS